jgi:hypothetical protein
MAEGRPELMRRIAADRDQLRVEAVFALKKLAAVSFTDLMLRRLSHVLGPCMEDTSLREMHELYLRERSIELPGDYDSDRRELEVAIEKLQGGAFLPDPSSSEVQGA